MAPFIYAKDLEACLIFYDKFRDLYESYEISDEKKQVYLKHVTKQFTHRFQEEIVFLDRLIEDIQLEFGDADEDEDDL